MRRNLKMHPLDLAAVRSIFATEFEDNPVLKSISSNSDLTEIFAAYASGTLDPALTLLLGTQRSLRGDTDTALAMADILSGALLERETPAQMSDNALESAFSAIDALETSKSVVNSPVALASNALDEILALPDPLRGFAIEAAGKAGWQRTAPGIQRLTLDVGSDVETEIYRIEPGTAVPRHSHEGSEFTLVVSGGFTDETGNYGPGDLSVNGPDDTHQPIADAGEICFTLAVRDGGLKFTGLMGLIQKLVG